MPSKGVDLDFARSIAEQGHLPTGARHPQRSPSPGWWELFVAETRRWLRVNPLVRTPDLNPRAGCKITLDGADFRQPGHAEVRGSSCHRSTGVEKARSTTSSYVKLDGQVGIIGNGARLGDIDFRRRRMPVKYSGVKPANFLDIGGGASAE